MALDGASILQLPSERFDQAEATIPYISDLLSILPPRLSDTDRQKFAAAFDRSLTKLFQAC